MVQPVVWLGDGRRPWEGYPEWRERQVVILALQKAVSKIMNEYVYNNCFYLQLSGAG